MDTFGPDIDENSYVGRKWSWFDKTTSSIKKGLIFVDSKNYPAWRQDIMHVANQTKVSCLIEKKQRRIPESPGSIIR